MSTKVPVAYVTKWAATRGIEVVRDAERSATFPDYLSWRGSLIRPDDWTENQPIAELRYADALNTARKAALRKAKRLGDALNAPPKYTEES